MALKRLSEQRAQFLGASVIVAVSILGCPVQEEEPCGFYYGYGGEKVPLYLTKELIGVRFDGEMSERDRAAIVAGEPTLRPYAQREIREVLGEVDMEVLRVRFWATKPAVLETIDRLNDTPGVVLATPVFHIVSGKNELLTDEFYASFDLSVPEEGILALNAEHAVEVVEVWDHSSIGIMGYRLRVTKDSGMNALDMANLYHEDPLTLRAAPTFQPLYPLVAKADPRFPLSSPTISSCAEKCTSGNSTSTGPVLSDGSGGGFRRACSKCVQGAEARPCASQEA